MCVSRYLIHLVCCPQAKEIDRLLRPGRLMLLLRFASNFAQFQWNEALQTKKHFPRRAPVLNTSHFLIHGGLIYLYNLASSAVVLAGFGFFMGFVVKMENMKYYHLTSNSLVVVFPKDPFSAHCGFHF